MRREAAGRAGGGKLKRRAGKPQVWSKLPARDHAWFLQVQGEPLLQPYRHANPAVYSNDFGCRLACICLSRPFPSKADSWGFPNGVHGEHAGAVLRGKEAQRYEEVSQRVAEEQALFLRAQWAGAAQQPQRYAHMDPRGAAQLQAHSLSRTPPFRLASSSTQPDSQSTLLHAGLYACMGSNLSQGLPGMPQQLLFKIEDPVSMCGRRTWRASGARCGSCRGCGRCAAAWALPRSRAPAPARASSSTWAPRPSPARPRPSRSRAPAPPLTSTTSTCRLRRLMVDRPQVCLLTACMRLFNCLAPAVPLFLKSLAWPCGQCLHWRPHLKTIKLPCRRRTCGRGPGRGGAAAGGREARGGGAGGLRAGRAGADAGAHLLARLGDPRHAARTANTRVSCYSSTSATPLPWVGYLSMYGDRAEVLTMW